MPCVYEIPRLVLVRRVWHDVSNFDSLHIDTMRLDKIAMPQNKDNTILDNYKVGDG